MVKTSDILIDNLYSINPNAVFMNVGGSAISIAFLLHTRANTPLKAAGYVDL
jgi:hypothetical protein